MKKLEYYYTREKIIRLIREFFTIRNFHEVITPVLNDSIPFEPNIYPFETEWKTIKRTKKIFLATSPEKNLKKMLALGIGNCFSIGHSFRNLESSGPLHNPEFLMLEWYRKNSTYNDIMIDVQNLIVSIYRYIDTSSKKWPVFSLPQLFRKYTNIDLVEFIAEEKNRADYDKLFVNEIESRLPKTPLFLIDYPSIISPLCKPKKDNPLLAERFEFYMNGIELANGNTENTDVKSVKKGLQTPIDQEFLQSLKIMNKTSYAGVGLGIDRLTMIFSNSSYIKFD